MNKKYIVRLSDEERQVCQEVVKNLKGTSQKVRRAQILLKADADELGWTDAKIAEAFNCRVQTIENLRKRLGLDSFVEERNLGKTINDLTTNAGSAIEEVETTMTEIRARPRCPWPTTQNVCHRLERISRSSLITRVRGAGSVGLRLPAMGGVRSWGAI